MMGIVHLNALFHLRLIRVLLPQLRRSPGPVLVMNIGSYSGDTPPPRLAIYAASKRFIEFLTRGLAMDERFFTPTNVKFMYLVVGSSKQLETREPPVSQLGHVRQGCRGPDWV